MEYCVLCVFSNICIGISLFFFVKIGHKKSEYIRMINERGMYTLLEAYHWWVMSTADFSTHKKNFYVILFLIWIGRIFVRHFSPFLWLHTFSFIIADFNQKEPINHR